VIPELRTERLVLRLAQPGMQAAMAGFLADNFEGHLDRWSPPVATDFFTAAFWADRLQAAVDDYLGDRAVRFVLQASGAALGAPILGTCNYTNIVRGAFHACHLGYQVARDHEGRGIMS
jgi:ribosomal-protein-alanine N-acetyltransferase